MYKVTTGLLNFKCLRHWSSYGGDCNDM